MDRKGVIALLFLSITHTILNSAAYLKRAHTGPLRLCSLQFKKIYTVLIRESRTVCMSSNVISVRLHSTYCIFAKYISVTVDIS